jgi:pilus assembly protein CpaF
MMSGHPGSLATIHANDALSAVLRLELLSRMNTVPLPPDVARSQVALAIDLVVQIERRGHVRRITSISEVAGLDPQGQYVVRDLFRFRTRHDGNPGRLEATGERASFADELWADTAVVV